jgi:threonine-phosphate decarboxylase
MNAGFDQSTHGGNIWAAQEEWGVPVQEILDFSASVNPLGPSPLAWEAVKAGLDWISHYPEPGAESCKLALSRHLGVEPQQIVLGNGGSELIYLLGRMFYQSRILLVAPCFSEYGGGLTRPRIHHFPLPAQEGFRLPLSQFLDAIEPDDLLFLGNPNNPTGNLWTREALLEIITCAGQKNARVVIDEAFLDFAGDAGKSLRDRVLPARNLIVVGSLTKFIAIPGLRLGYAVAHPQTASAMEDLLPPWRINTLASAAARASLEDRTYIADTIAVVTREREFLAQELSRLGFQVYPGSANFLLLAALAAKGMPAREIQERLGPYRILIRLCHDFINLSPYHFRIAVRSRRDNLRLLEALKEMDNCMK